MNTSPEIWEILNEKLTEQEVSWLRYQFENRVCVYSYKLNPKAGQVKKRKV
jgi:hypothetical protein